MPRGCCPHVPHSRSDCDLHRPSLAFAAIFSQRPPQQQQQPQQRKSTTQAPKKPTGDPSKLISKCYIKANKTQSRNAATKMLSRPLTFGNLKINKVVCYAKWQREAKPKRRCSRCCCCCGTCGFLGCNWVCGELWEVRLGSCVPRCNKLQKINCGKYF